MRLPDFEPTFAELRQLIGATETVVLESFEWDGSGIEVDYDLIQVDHDRTFSYEGRRVLVYIRQQVASRRFFRRSSGYKYHLTECSTLKAMRGRGAFDELYVVSTRIDGRVLVDLVRRRGGEPFKKGVETDLTVCKNCLANLDWKGYKRVEFSVRNNIWKDFDPAEFFEHYGSSVSVLQTPTRYAAPSNNGRERSDENGTQETPQSKEYQPPNIPDQSGATKVSDSSRAEQPRTREDDLARASLLEHFCCDCGLILEELKTRNVWLKVYADDPDRLRKRHLCLDCYSNKSGKEGTRETSEFREFQRWLKSGSDGEG